MLGFYVIDFDFIVLESDLGIGVFKGCLGN